jgi:anti-sigma regulatory factor (Ser/Thr protein kinase)
MTSHRIHHPIDMYSARQAVETLAATLGFQRREQQELAIVVSELCSNIIKYGIRGSVELEPINDTTHGAGVSIVARDVGPPFRDLGMALQDGCDDQGPIDPSVLLKRSGLGIGLGAVVRLTDALDVQQQPEGKAIRAVRYLKRPRYWRSSGSSF